MTVLRSMLREPLLQFLLAGAVLLLAQRVLAPSVAGTSQLQRIDVPEAQLKTLDETFRAAHGRLPDQRERNELAQRWIDEEVLYRQALVLGIDRTDAIVRRELQQKMRFLLEDTTPIAEPTELQLQQWLDQRPQQYGRPSTTSFEQIFFSRSRSDQPIEMRATKALQALTQSGADASKLGDPFPGSMQWPTQSEADLKRNFGGEFARALATLPLNVWSGPVRSGLGLHLVRVTARADYAPVKLDEVRHQVQVDYRLARRAEMNRKALDALRAQYDIRIAEVAP